MFYLQLNIPVFTMPFTLTTLFMIYVTDKCGLLHRVEDMSYPEKQTYEWHTRTKDETKVSKIYLDIKQSIALVLLQIYNRKPHRLTFTVFPTSFVFE